MDNHIAALISADPRFAPLLDIMFRRDDSLPEPVTHVQRFCARMARDIGIFADCIDRKSQAWPLTDFCKGAELGRFIGMTDANLCAIASATDRANGWRWWE